MKSEKAKIIGANIRRIRKSKSITLRAFGEYLGVAYQTISQWERGERLIKADRMTDIAEVLQVQLADLYEGVEEVTEPLKIELKKCPFCGGEAGAATAVDAAGEENTFSVVCRDCGTGIFKAWIRPEEEWDGYKDIYEAVKAWNRRAT